MIFHVLGDENGVPFKESPVCEKYRDLSMFDQATVDSMPGTGKVRVLKVQTYIECIKHRSTTP